MTVRDRFPLDLLDLVALFGKRVMLALRGFRFHDDKPPSFKVERTRRAHHYLGTALMRIPSLVCRT